MKDIKKEIKTVLRKKLPKLIGVHIKSAFITKLTARFPFLNNRYIRFEIVSSLILIIAVFVIVLPFIIPRGYNLGTAGSLLQPVNQTMADSLKYDSKKQVFNFNNGQSLPTSESIQTGAQQISAVVHKDPSKGINVTDPVNKINFSLTPEYSLQAGKQQGNRVIYPLINGTGWTVYTMQGTGVKEDILLNRTNSDKTTFDYKLGLGDGLVARIESDGSIGVYGNTILSGNVTAGSAKDASLLQKARQNAQKNTYLFNIPKPVILERNGEKSSATASFSLHGSDLSLNVTGLNNADYPLSIDPSIYVVTAQQFMAGNNETNINFDVADKLIEKGPTTGARFNTWNPTTNLNTTTWRQGVAAAGGYIYTIGGIHPNGGEVSYTSAGTGTFVVPAGITSITVKAWGAGGGGGGGGRNSVGGAGGGGGFTQTTLAVTPNETLNVMVGGGGGGGASGGTRGSGAGGGGGGYSGLTRNSTSLVVAAGGAGGGGGGYNSGHTGGAGGAGGGTTGGAGGASGSDGGGGGGTPSAGGSAGSGGNNAGTAGSSLTGGPGGDGRSSAGSDGGANNGGIGGGGSGGAHDVTSRHAGGGGGSGGYYGGGGGSGSGYTTGGGGGGGGSSYTSGSSSTNTAGSGTTPGNPSDPDRGTAGGGGGGGKTRSTGGGGKTGRMIISYTGNVAGLDTVSWAQFNTTTSTIDAANPGNGTCSGWCTNTAYKLPSPRSAMSVVAYNGFLYAIGGEDTSCTTANGTGDNGVCKTVYIAKLGANGEPQLWNPTDTNKSNWVYWYRGADLTTPRSFTAAVAYNNRMYLLGGKTSSSGTASIVNTVEIADIIPTGTLGNWTTSSASLPYNVYGHGAQVYNDRLYLVGGASSIGGAPLSSVYYIKINSDGTLNNWIQTNGLADGKISNGGNFTTVWGGYLYINGGCSAVNANGYCTTVDSNTQMASINADGSLDIWNTNGSVSDARMGQSIVAWRNNIYEIGGCTSQDPSTGACTTALNTINFGTINQDGDASTVNQSVASGTSPCSGTSPNSCNLPGTSYIGNMLSGTFITNGYLYVVGGCTNNTCSTTTGNVAYTAISSTGIMTQPATCPSGIYRGGTWCVDTTHKVNGGIAATSPIVFGGYVYLVGGLNGSANTNSIVRAGLNNDGSITAWTSQSMTGLGMTSVSYSYGYARSNPASAGTNPGNLYVFGGCRNSSAAGCTAYSQNVYKCNLQTSGAIAACSTSGQQQIGIVPGDTAPGLGIMSGTVYANYIYLIGGVSPNQVDLATVRYAKFDNNNNVVSADGSGTWIQSPNQMAIGRRRASAFGYNGYIYVVGGYDATQGVLPDIEFIKVNVSNGSLGSATDGFNVSAVKISQRWGLSVPVSNSFAYVIGGCTVGSSPSGCTTRTDVIQTFQIYNNDSGAPAGYTTSANTYSTNPNRIGASSVILNGYIYTAGGCISTTDCTTAINTVSYAPIDTNGNIGTWSNTTASLPAVRTWGKLEAAGGTLYYIGGQSSNATDWRSEVYYGTPSSGNVTSWGTANKALPSARSQFAATVWNNRLYVVGGKGTGTGCTASNVCNTVYVSPQLNTGGNITSAWSTASTSFNVARSGLSALAYANNLYLFGGYDGSNYLSDSQYSQINTSNGLAGSWTYTTNLPSSLSQADSFAANGYVYLIGGRSNTTTCAPITLVAPISANTTIASGNNPTGIGEWYETNQRYTGNRYGASAVYNDGKAYVLGGACGSTLTYASPVTQQTVVLSQPQVAKYSIMINTDSDVFPTNWLLNGVDNSIGARWQLKYRSMPNTTTSCVSPAMTTWGQETNFGDVTLGLPGVYVPKDGNGNDTNCARFYYFNVTVDSSQAYGYPDDVTRGPTIKDLTLQFTADPSKRLMHGRTFTGGLQQPIDTPYYSH